MNSFKGQNLLEFSDRFKTDENCKEYLAEIKWNDGFKCRKCGHKKPQVRKDFSRTCNICSLQESATFNTLFHKVKFGMHKAFFIVFKMATSTKIHQIKFWIRTTSSCVSDFNRYFNEFCFRINHSQSKATIFNNLITKMINKDKVYGKQIICN